MGGSSKPGWSNTYTGIPAYDTAQIAQRAEGTQAGRDWANTPLQTTNSMLQQAQGYFGGDPSLTNAFMNPYLQSVVNPMQQQFAQQNQGLQNTVANNAQAAGGWGGSRGSLAQGVALGQNMNNQNLQLGNLYNSGYQNAQGLAGNAASNLFNAGQYNNEMVNKDAAHKAQALAATFAAYPHATQSLTTGDAPQASGGKQAAGTVAQLAPLVMAFL